MISLRQYRNVNFLQKFLIWFISMISIAFADPKLLLTFLHPNTKILILSGPNMDSIRVQTKIANTAERWRRRSGKDICILTGSK